MNRRSGGLIAAGVVLVLVAGGAGGFAWHRSRQSAAQDTSARAAAQAFVTAWRGRSLAGVGFLGTTGSAMATEYATAVAGMGPVTPTVRLGPVTRTGARASAQVQVSWPVAAGATNAAWAYRSLITLTQQSGRWLVSPEGAVGASIFAPITRDAHLSLSRTQPERADLTGAGGAPIVATGPVVDVGIEPARVVDAATLVRQVARITGVDATALATAVAAAAPHAFVPVITLRQSDYDAVREKLQPLHGTVFRARSQSLALTRDFARALIGTVGPVTAEIVGGSSGRYAAGDFAGVSGLQREYDAQLAGTAGVTVNEVTTDSSGAPSATVLFHTDPVAGKPLATTLDPGVQQAADHALSALRVPGALVAVDVRTGAVLAVANTPTSGLDRAMVGQYPPGSTLKVATTLALLEGGLRPTTPVDCPGSITVGGRSFRNYEHEQAGVVPFSTDFAKSCNTAFVGLSKRLKAGDLHAAAAQLGLGLDWSAGLGAGPQVFTGSVPVTTSAVDQAAAAFGQGRTLVSPLAMAVAAGSVARGRYLAPTLVTAPAPTAAAAPASAAPPAADIATLHALMRLVVTSGTAAGQLTGVPGGLIYAKTGTAEFGGATPPQTHAWLIGWQGSVAFAAFVDTGRSGGSVAGPVVKRFLTALHHG